ncbi:MAG: cupin domain-containing protein [Methylocystaceae bacterium]|nr:cupin domain-containing protein [Methylocystaceae bacterium]
MSTLDCSSVDEIVRALDLVPHPEGGFYRETFRDPLRRDGRAVSTAIYYLLPAGRTSAWHRVDAAELWHYYAGAPLMLSIMEGAAQQTLKLGNSFTEGQRPQVIVPANSWQSARSLGKWTLAGCTVAPGFEFSRFELAAEGRFEAEGRDC